MPVQLQVLVNLSELFASQGQTNRAAALLGLVRHHPVSERWTQEKAARLLDELGLLPPDVESESLDAVVAEILTEMS
jgi:hypothetical protein